MKRLLFILLFVACASGPPPPTPQFAAVPASVLDVLCARLHEEGIARETTVDVVRTSRPLVTRQSLQALAEAAFYSGRPDPRAVEAAYATNATPLPLAANEGCTWNLIDANARRSRDTMTLEVSAPFVMPISKGGVGVLARMALAGESATWYWIPLANRNGTWMAMRSMPLAAHE
ncbi:MAG TPA: hypothetical protein VJZ76_13105 [Thermoanaerobaculia bacterium]|nr:hypothetical protein [Thermoanaerobaculia bacterium]